MYIDDDKGDEAAASTSNWGHEGAGQEAHHDVPCGRLADLHGTADESYSLGVGWIGKLWDTYIRVWTNGYIGVGPHVNWAHLKGLL